MTTPVCPICNNPAKQYTKTKFAKTCGDKKCRYELTNASNGKTSKSPEELKEARRVRQRKAYAANPAIVKQRIQKAREDNIDDAIAYERAQYAKHADKRVCYAQERYTRERDTIVGKERSKREKLVENFDIDPEPILRRLMNSASKRARDRGMEFDLTIDFLLSILPSHCPVLGIKLAPVCGGTSRDTSPSIDRLDNKRGYTQDNVVIVSCRANLLKKDGSKDEFEKILAYYFS